MTAQNDPAQLVSKLNPVVLDFVYVGIATFFASFMEIYLFALAGRTAHRRLPQFTACRLHQWRVCSDPG